MDTLKYDLQHGMRQRNCDSALSLPSVHTPKSRGATSAPSQSAKSRLGRTPSSKQQPRRPSRAARKGPRSKGIFISTGPRYHEEDSDYDTDLEEQGNVKECFVDNKPVELTLYEKMCRRYNVVPVDYYIRHMNSRRLVMRYHCLGPNGASALAVPLQINTSIKELDLEGNFVNSEGGRHIAHMLQENLYITNLNLAYNKLGSSGARYMCEALLRNRTITKLDLSGNGFTDKDAPCIADVIENNTVIKEFLLRENGFCEEGGVCIGQAVANNESLQVLDLSWNHLRLKGAEHIAKALQANNILRKLNLSMNGFSTGGVKYLSVALMSNSDLQYLDLTDNRIDVAGALELAKALSKNTGLKKLRLGLNPILFTGALALIQAIYDNADTELEYLDLQGMLVNEEFMDMVRDIRHGRDFEVRVGFVTKSQNLVGNREVLDDRNPLEILMEFMAQQNLRLVDLFKSLDKDQSNSLTRDEFVDGLKMIETPLSEAQMDELIGILDKDGDGEVDLGEILNINKEFKHIKMKAKKKVMETRQKIQQAKTKVAAVGAIIGAMTS